MRLKGHYILRWQTIDVLIFLMLAGSALTSANVWAQETTPKAEMSRSQPGIDQAKSDPPAAASEMPDITGTWQVEAIEPDSNENNFFTWEIRRVQQGEIDFLIDMPWVKEPLRLPVKWSAVRQRFEGEYKDDDSDTEHHSFFTLQPQPDGNSLLVIFNPMKESEAYVTQIWTRVSKTLATTYPSNGLQQPETPSTESRAEELMEGADLPAGGTATTNVALQPSALPNTPAAKDLLKRLEAQESAAATAANEIRRLQANGDAAETIAPHQAQLKAHLQSAFELKMQLEELQVKELQSRLSRLERQIGQRKEIRDKIVERRAAELLNPDASWETTATKTSVAVPPIAGATDRDAGRSRDPLANPNVALLQIRLRCDRRLSINDGTEVVFADNGQIAIMSVSPGRQMEFSFVEGAENSRGPFLLSVQYNGSAATAATWLANNVLPIEFLAGDQDRATSGQLVENVVYVDSASGAVGTISSHTIEPGIDPGNAAATKGIVIGVVRISKGVLKRSTSTDETTNAASTQKNAKPPNTAGTKVNDPRGDIEAIATFLDARAGAIKNISVTTDYKKRHVYGLPFDAPIELTFVTKTVIDSEGRLRVETAGQQINIEPDGKSARAYNGRWETVFQKGEARSLTWYESNPPTASIDNFPSLHGIHPREFTTHFQSKPVSEIIRTRAAEVTERVMWDDRPVTIVQTTPHQNANDARRYRFWIDQERNVVVRRAISIRYAEGQPWQEYARIENHDYQEIAPGIWLPGKVKYESLEVTPELTPAKLSWSFEGTNHDWMVNRELPADTFELAFPEGTFVNDHRTPGGLKD